MNAITCITTFTNRMEAEVAKSTLDAEHIQSFIEADDAGGAYPFPLSGHQKGIQLFIKEKDRERAKDLLHV